MTEPINLAELRGPRAKPAALVTERELAALIDVAEAAHRLDTSPIAEFDEAQWVDLHNALARFDFGNPWTTRGF